MFHFVWLLGCDLYVDDQKIGFKGRHVNKMRISYKNEGGGFEAGALCNRGYIYIFLLRNEGVPKEYMLMGIEPFHAHIFSLFITLCNEFHEIHLDNIYKSKKYSHLSYTHHNCVKVQGVYQTIVRVIPRELLQTELHDNKSVD